jgi:uncharacterized paraquat-inducible protein A
MASDENNVEQSISWESVHVCPNCDLAIDLARLDLGSVTTGVVSCPRCDWAGRIEISVVNSDRLKS